MSLMIIRLIDNCICILHYPFIYKIALSAIIFRSVGLYRARFHSSNLGNGDIQLWRNKCGRINKIKWEDRKGIEKITR